MVNNIAIIGSSGAIGSAFTQQLARLHPDATIHAFSRNEAEALANHIIHHTIDYKSEACIEESASLASKDSPLDMVIVATGILHNVELMPEKSLRELSAEKFKILFEVLKKD